nr:immunoglobulin heavy chain junction region [Macaca mulatta]MOW86534.1 immunoglobulin heavy chain junction region [Macaca mulatta]MOW86591.1 immunoglobulin heavy chain junction region [Macaca mulatta]MOW86619.1 immunoglobulin heavy chain junction region [Macaca mulatta]MOW86646.1 immunoglobulin heavy chain junction region [Macaca mulatta]
CAKDIEPAYYSGTYHYVNFDFW